MSTGAGTTWSKEETLKLIEVWGQETIQKQLQECKRNQTVYEEVAKEMREAGYERTYQQCRDKIKKLKGDYKKEKDKQGRTGEGRTSWDYFDAMDAVLGHRPATRPPVVIDTSTTSRPVTPVTPATPGGSEFGEGGDDDEEEQPIVNEGEAGSSTQSVTSGQSGSRKRKRTTRSDSTMAELMERVISAQTKSDEKMIELEEKRMKMEERQMEREAQQRREEREFQMQMMRMMMMGPGMHHFPPPSTRPSLGHPSSMDQSSSSLAFGEPDMYNPYGRDFEGDS